jgi:hypothetical protein
VRAIVHDAAANHYRLEDLITDVVLSTPFRMRMSAPVTSDASGSLTADSRIPRK